MLCPDGATHDLTRAAVGPYRAVNVEKYQEVVLDVESNKFIASSTVAYRARRLIGGAYTHVT